jgi:putative nucleotidyltransferase with HDIG domain
MIPIGWFAYPIDQHQIGTLIYLGVGTQIAALLPIRWLHGNQYIYDPLLLATGLLAPGAGVALVAWLALFDGRIPGRDAPWWALVFNRANTAIDNVLPSLAVLPLRSDEWWSLPAMTIAYVVLAMALNYSVTARALSLVNRTSFFSTLSQNIGATTLTSTMVLSFSGGILYLTLSYSPNIVGYVMAPGLFGFLLAVRGNVADAQRQAQLKDQTLDLAAQALDQRDRYTESHSIRVADLAGRLGDHLELGARQCELIRTAGSLHDLGKIGVRDDILNKAGPLTEDEWEVMRRHSDIGADMIAQHSALMDVAPLVRHHHERWDGTGYPAGLKGDVIPFGARILAVADSFDTITGPRLYRKSLMTPREGVEDISRRANRWYDPNVVDALRELHGLAPLDLAERPEVPRRVTTLRVMGSNPAFARLAVATAISAVGDPLTQVATLVSIYAQTGDPRFVALAFITQALGTIVIASLLGGAADRLRRRPLIVSLELVRAVTLVATPALLSARWWLIIPVLFVLASINAIVQPARQAAIPALVPSGQVGKANAIIATTTMIGGAIGFALAGSGLSFLFTQRLPVSTLFYVDAATFAVAALLILSIPSLGGGSVGATVSGAIRRSWAIAAARPHLVLAAGAAFLLAISFPALLALAYRVAEHRTGGETYSMLEVVLSLGIFVGSLAVARFASIGSMRTVGAGLLLTGLFSLAITASPSLMWIGIFLFVASVGNPIYTVANQTAVLEAADATNRGSLMAVRFGLVQAASIAGAAVGGVILQQGGKDGAFFAYGVIGVGLILLAMYALAAGRSMVNPLHGKAYEDAQRKATSATAAQQPSRLT